ncbi:MAG: PDC sensor domain-containing protein [Pseudomonadota bacterium]|nr:PDC sensor domain-containing protein [Pseudomonadota bacterium]
MSKQLQNLIKDRRHELELELVALLDPVASKCGFLWNEPAEMDMMLSQAINEVPGCQLMYAFDRKAHRVSQNISVLGVDLDSPGKDLSGRPFLACVRPRQLSLSDVYLSRVTKRSCITAIHIVRDESGRHRGYLAADFGLSEFPLKIQDSRQESSWLQIRGDPAIRGTLFQQTRFESPMDRHIDDTHSILSELMSVRGVFHAKLHYGSSRATLWLYKDPHHYRVHVLHEILDPSICLIFGTDLYPPEAIVSADQIPSIFQRFRDLRMADDIIYLRSASLNIINNLVSLTFSCDGTYYMSADDFLSRPESFWFGDAGRSVPEVSPSCS